MIESELTPEEETYKNLPEHTREEIDVAAVGQSDLSPRAKSLLYAARRHYRLDDLSFLFNMEKDMYRLTEAYVSVPDDLYYFKETLTEVANFMEQGWDENRRQVMLDEGYS